MKSFLATIIWKIQHKDFKGSNWHILQFAEQLDGVTMEIINFESRQDEKRSTQKMTLIVSGHYPTNQRVADDEELEEYIFNEIQKTSLPSVYLILAHMDKTETNQP